MSIYYYQHPLLVNESLQSGYNTITGRLSDREDDSGS